METNTYELDRHGRGESHHASWPPQLIALPANTQQVVDIMKFCGQHKVPVIPFGVGTSLEGHVAAVQGGVCVDTQLLQDMQLPSLQQDDFPDAVATVGAGVTRLALNEALRHTGLEFKVDPGANATLGGMTATHASGTTAVKYGTMKDNLLALEVVLPNSKVINVGCHALKNSAGYDLLALMCGSEGTLGIITSVTVKLHPISSHVVAAVCVFETLEQAAQAVASLKFQSIPLSRCELLDASSVKAFNQYTSCVSNQGDIRQMQELPTLFLELEGSSETMVQELVQQAQQICVEDHSGQQFAYVASEAERKSLWAARHQLYYASFALRGDQGPTDNAIKTAIVTDACVPLSQLAKVMHETAQDILDSQVVGPMFGHAGDGNFHCILPVWVDADTRQLVDDPDYVSKLHAINDRLIQRTLAVNGTCTGEHGIGFGKANYLKQQYGAATVDLMRTIKQAIDPHNIMNPGKIVGGAPPTED